MMNKWEWNQFGSLLTPKDIQDYLDGRAYSHGTYCHYTTLTAVDGILGSKEFWIKGIQGVNDENDKRQFGNSKQQLGNFALCFSTGQNENLPLWYLYSGVDGMGARLELTKSNIKKLVDGATFFLTEKADTKKRVPLAATDFNMEFRDIIYCRKKRSSDYYDLKYNNLTNYNKISVAAFDEYRKEHTGFFKDLIWYYEKETRLLVTLTDEGRKKLEKDKDQIIVLTIPNDVYNHLKIRFAPEITEEKRDEIFQDHKNITKFMYDYSRVGLSEHSGTVLFNICKNCKKNGGKT